MEKAHQLRQAGLTGVNISLDHWQAEAHNRFRGLATSYQWVKQASHNARKANLAVCFSLCATREFVTEENLWQYASLAKRLGAGFIQILEPRAVGHFSGQDVELPANQIDILTAFFQEINTLPQARRYPTVFYPGYHQRQLGCYGAGNRYLFVDAEGYIHACPFCQQKQGHCTKDSLNDSINALQQRGCHAFDTAPESNEN